MASIAILTYGTLPDRVELLLSGTVSYEERAVMSSDGSRYLYSHHKIVCRAVVNPMATQPPRRPPEPILHPRDVRAGLLPADVIKRIDELLMEPRRKLVYRIGNEVVLESPQRSADGVELTVDANQGPVPLFFRVDEVLGPQSATVSYGIQTWIRKGFVAEVNPTPTVLSHQWDVDSDINEDYLTTRTITGKIVFRRDLLEIRNGGSGLYPSDFFPALAEHPVPSGYQRTSVHAHYGSDRTSVEYTIVDEQRPWGVRPVHGILRCEGWLEREHDWNAVNNPKMRSHLHLEVVGYPSSRSVQLVAALANIRASMRNGRGELLQDRLGAVNGIAPFQLGRVHIDFPARHATFDQSLTMGGVFGPLGIAADFDILSDRVTPEDFGRIGGPTQRINPAMGTRGNTMDPFLSLVTQTLTSPRTDPALPGAGRGTLNLVS